MRIMLWVLGLAAIGWCGFWYIASSGIERGANAWFDLRRAEGWAADYASLETGGFPYRFDTRLTEISLADPDTGVVWSMPEFEVTALAYQPGHVIALFPETMTLASPFTTIELTNEDMRASARLSGTNLTLSEGTGETSGVVARSSQGWQVTMDRALLATRAMVETPNSYDLFFEATNLRPSDALRLGVDPQGRLPDTFETLKLDATAGFDAPWDRFAIERARPQPTSLDLKGFDARWGQLELRAVGTLDIAQDGTPAGRITVKATNWREIISIGQALGMIPDSMVNALTRGLELLAGLSGPSNTLDIPLNFERGSIFVGPIPIGPAPKLRLR